jgi:DNA-binding transcriptional regulator YbjK
MTKDRSSVKTYMAASVLNPTAEGVSGLNDEADETLFEAKIQDLEAKEADIIHELYVTHFVVTDPNAEKSTGQ